MKQLVHIADVPPGQVFDSLFWPSLAHPFTVIARDALSGDFTYVPCLNQAQVKSVMDQYPLHEKIIFDKTNLMVSGAALASLINWPQK
jgi:hypothetical protein